MEPVGRGSKLAWRASNPTWRVLKPAGRASEPARRVSESAGRPRKRGAMGAMKEERDKERNIDKKMRITE